MSGALDKNCQIDIQRHLRILVTDFVKNMETKVGFRKNAKTHYEKLREGRINYQANLKILLLLQNLKLKIEQQTEGIDNQIINYL
ncbi:hypothetical protein FLA4_11360 [Candidatus Rickettsia kotlanii]|nr:hypothetical protein FLA4_11360 [Candidatus Rickettsia kotlanii]BDU61968.1 hypothetical protein HM2_11360 [Candidatus Rickettsia kotlanii]